MPGSHKGDSQSCFVCGSPLETQNNRSTILFCPSCSSFGDVPLAVHFEEAARGERHRTVLSAYERSQRHRVVFALSQRYGLIRFQMDLWRTGWQVRQGTCQQLKQIWESNDKAACVRTRGGIHGTFSPSIFRFDVSPERADYWTELLRGLFSSNAALLSVSASDHGANPLGC